MPDGRLTMAGDASCFFGSVSLGRPAGRAAALRTLRHPPLRPPCPRHTFRALPLHPARPPPSGAALVTFGSSPLAWPYVRAHHVAVDAPSRPFRIDIRPAGAGAGEQAPGRCRHSRRAWWCRAGSRVYKGLTSGEGWCCSWQSLTILRCPRSEPRASRPARGPAAARARPTPGDGPRPVQRVPHPLSAWQHGAGNAARPGPCSARPRSNG